MAARRWATLAIAVAAIGALLILASTLPIQDRAAELATGLQGYGAAGMAIFAFVFAGLAMVFVPTSPLSFAAGLVYGWSGALLAWVTMMTVAAFCFVMTRRLLGARVRRAMEAGRRLRLIADIVDARGWRIVLLVRVSGLVPFGVQNYAFGATRITFVQFILATAVGVLPSIVVAASAGVAGRHVLTGGLDPLHVAALCASVIAAFLLIALTARDLRARLRAADRAQPRDLPLR